MNTKKKRFFKKINIILYLLFKLVNFFNNLNMYINLMINLLHKFVYRIK